MPHLVDRDDDLLRSDGGIGEFARFVANPVQDGDVADPENPRYLKTVRGAGYRFEIPKGE